MKRQSKALKNVKNNYSLPFWSWNGKLSENKLREQIGWMKKRDFGGFFMHARAGLKTEYLSDEWFNCVSACISEASSLGLEPWAYDENGWPSGFCGGKLLNNKDYLENYLEYGFGKKDESALVSYDISGSALKRLKAGEQSQNCLNVFKRTAISTVDVLDKKVVKAFINCSHEQYKQKLGDKFKLLRGFFTDEPQYCRVATPYPHDIADEYGKLLGKDILDGLGLLFIEKDGYRQFRYDYWKLCQSLFLNSFAKLVYDWCEQNGVQLTGHYIEERDLYAQMLFNAGIMPFYEYEHIPGIDWLCRRFMSVVPARQVGSVAAQLGKKRVLSETFAMTGWDATPRELKAIAEFQFLYGVNTMCQHLLPYSEIGDRKNDYPQHFTAHNPWVNADMGEFNNYFNVLGGLMQSSEEFCNVAVLHPQRSAYFCYKHGDPSSTAYLDAAFIELSDSLARSNVGFHYLDETLLAKYGSVSGDKIRCGKREYSYLIIPKCHTMDKTTERLLREFVLGGGKVYIAFEKPEYLEGEPFDYDYLQSNVGLEQIRQAQPYRAETLSKSVYSAYRSGEGYNLVMLLNTSEDCSAEVKLSVSGAAYALDLLRGAEEPLSGNIVLKPYESKIIALYPEQKTCNCGGLLGGCDSLDCGGAVVNNCEKPIIELPCDNLKINRASDNALVLDYARYSFNGVDYGEKQLIYGIFDELLQSRYNGELYLDFEFETKAVPSSAKILSEYENAVVFVNGVAATRRLPYAIEPDANLIDVSDLIKVGLNHIKLKINFYQSEKVYYALFGDGVTEGLKNCLVYDTYLERLTLFGDFGVFSHNKFEHGIENGVIYGSDFYIDNKKTIINDLITGGYPFFCGDIEFERHICLDRTNVKLHIPGRLFSGEVFVNDKSVGSLLFDDTFDISEAARLGDNVVRVILHTGCRNLFGPHHDARIGENKGVTPFAFTLPNTWHNGYSVLERKAYSLMQSGIFK